MTTFNRKNIREEFATLIENAMVGENKPLAAVYPYLVSEKIIGGNTPIIAIGSVGTEREKADISSTRYSGVVKLKAFILVASSSESWTEQDAMDKLDEIEAALADLVSQNRRTQNWHYVDYSDFSEIKQVEVIGGQSYTVEAITFDFEVRD